MHRARSALAVFGDGDRRSTSLQAFTAAILVLAANTAYNGFPVLASILAQDGYLPRQLARRGDRLVFSNGIVLLAAGRRRADLAFDADVTRLIQLYIIGVFVSFTLSQAGMVRHWSRRAARRRRPAARGARIRRARAINAIGAVCTGVVLVVVLVTKFTHGAWIVVIAMPLLFLLMRRIRRHYDARRRRAAPRARAGWCCPAASTPWCLVVEAATSRRCARWRSPARPARRPDRGHRPGRPGGDRRGCSAEWAARDVPVPLTVLESPYRDITRPVLDYVRSHPPAVARGTSWCVFIPEYVVGHWWETLLHNQSALRLKARLLFQPGVMVTSVPWQLGSSRAADRPTRTGGTDAGPAARCTRACRGRSLARAGAGRASRRVLAAAGRCPRAGRPLARPARRCWSPAAVLVALTDRPGGWTTPSRVLLVPARWWSPRRCSAAWGSPCPGRSPGPAR